MYSDRKVQRRQEMVKESFLIGSEQAEGVDGRTWDSNWIRFEAWEVLKAKSNEWDRKDLGM